EEWWLTRLQILNDRFIEIQSDNFMPHLCQTRRHDGPQMPQSKDTHFHARCPSSQEFSCKYFRVRITPSLIDNFGRQPRARIPLQVRKMNALSPSHPRSPPV